MSTIILIGTLRTESVPVDDPEGVGSPPRTDYRPERTPLLNDGRWHHWMAPGEDYDIDHDGVGWRVTCRTWGDSGHTYRLADADTWAMADRLPVEDWWMLLNPTRRYMLRFMADPWGWGVYEA